MQPLAVGLIRERWLGSFELLGAIATWSVRRFHAAARSGRLAWAEIDAAAADPQLARLPRHRQHVRTVDHRFALGNSPALPSAPDKKSFTSVNSPIFACNIFVNRRLGRLAIALRSENPRRPFKQLAAPRRDVVRVNVELLRQLGQRLLALHGSQGHLRLEGGAVVPARSLRHLISCSAAMLAAFRQKLHLAACPNFPSHLCYQRLKRGSRSPLTAKTLPGKI